MTFDCDIIDLGKISYKKAYHLQKRSLEELKLGLSNEALIICEHFPVITLGRSGNINNLLCDPNSLNAKGVDFFKIDRGGDITAHELGQLTIYPVFDLKMRKHQDIHVFLNNLQHVILNTLREFSLRAHVVQDKRGVWAGSKKIASIGIGISHWITYHGLTINVNNNLKIFSYIRPCGMDVEMTSVAKELGYSVDFNVFKHKLMDNFCKVFNLNIKTERNKGVKNETSNLTRTG